MALDPKPFRKIYEPVDRPFALPNRELIFVIFDIPPPPSLNKIWAHSRKGVRPSPEYERWKKKTDGYAMEQKIFRGRKTIKGAFTVELLIDESRLIDADNCLKAPLDYCQSRSLIADDKHCRKVTIEKVPKSLVPTGARLILTELAP